MKMYAKKLKRICDVKGCKNVETFAIGRYKQLGGGPVICRQCLEDALNVIDNPDTVAAEEKKNAAPVVPVFPRGIAPEFIETPKDGDNHDDNNGKSIDEKPGVNPDDGSDEEKTKTDDKEKKPFVCSNCGKSFKTQQGLDNHLKNCIKK